MILHRIRESYATRGLALYLAISMVFQIVYPTAALALTGGPSQPEVQSFSPVGTSDMVDLSSGDFNYNIPLLDVGGYPINMVYNGGITMDQEASWVGLGWNINPGVINRNMRGLPDDFDGDEIINQTYMKPNNTIGLSLGLGFDELFGTSPDLGSVGISTSLNMGITYNNYNGVSLSSGVGFSPNKGNFEGDLGLSASPGGLSINASVSFDKKLEDKLESNNGSINGSFGLGFNSRAGLTDMNINTSIKGKVAKKERYFNGGATISLVPNTYTPQIDHERTSFNASFSIKPEGTVFGIDAAATIGANYSRQKLVSNGDPVSTPAFGYLASEKARYASKGHSLMDFNREKDGSFNNGTTNLPLTNYTYDAYSISGQGVAGSFRPYRSDVGHVHDNKVISKSFSGNGSFEAGGGQLFDLGVNMRVNPSTSYSGDWKEGNNAWNALNFKSSSQSFLNNANDFYEPYYYKQSGELTVDNDGLFTKIKDYSPVQLELNDVNVGAFNVELENKLSKNGTGANTQVLNSQDLQRKKRVNRNQLISTLTDQEISVLKPWRVRSDWAKDHHVSEVSVTKNDGGRYIYGLAAYNTHQEDVTFALSLKGNNTDGDCHSGLVSYTPGAENKKKNGRGNDEFFSKTVLPPFAHSYLLTEVLSHDYVDVNNNGADDADYGSYTRFEYEKVDDYKWRVPFELNKANYNEGLKSDYSDEKGSYVYGEKDLQYLKKIETKTHVAVFHTNEDGLERADAKSTLGPNGGAGALAMRKLDRITLYSKGDWNSNYTGNGDYTSLTPIKEVHFEYAQYDNQEDELCQGGLPNAESGRGKLTLTKVYFTYGNSYKAKWSPYEFSYDQKNPSYNLKGYNVWGGYKENSNNGCSPLSPLTNAEFPYVEQNKTEADDNVNAWALKSIKLPSGGKINIEYESDDYAYVQDKQAMQMFKVIGACNEEDFDNQDYPFSGNSTPSIGYLYSRLINPVTDKVNNYLFFNLDDDDSNIAANNISDSYIVDKYGLKGDQKLQFRFLLDITDKSSDYEYVSGYCSIVQYGVVNKNNSGTGKNIGYIVVSPEQLSDKNIGRDVHPIAKAGWNFTRSFLPKVAFGLPNNFPSDDESNNGIKNLAKTLAQANIMHQVANFVKGPNNSLRLKDYCSAFVKEKSWIRLKNPNGKKLGGGARVKRIIMNDQWSSMVSNGSGDNSVYGQEYSYESEQEIEDGSGNKIKISSGVATYEPIQSKENPFIQPVFMTEKHLLAPNENNYIEEPFGESFFPSPTVTYARVEVKNIAPVGIENNKSGKVVHEFYTSKDYPTITKRDVMSAKRKGNATQLLSAITGVTKDFMTASQGYAIINNDMNGKQKAQWVLADGVNDISDAISGVEYVYNLNGTSVLPSATDPFIQTSVNTDAKQLNNNCILIHKNGKVKSGTIGIEYDAVADFRENKTDSETYGANMGLNGFLLGIFPGVIPSVIPSKKSDHTRFRSSVFTKVINQHGILREVVAHDLGAKVSTKNLAWDAETGEVLLTSVKNEYADEIYTLNYPAHWGYDRMGMASQNIGLTTQINYTSDGWYSNSKAGVYFVKGDELLLNKSIKAWVLKVNSTSLFLIDENGNAITENASNITTKVVRSGRKNQQALAIGSITLKKNPVVSDGGSGYLDLKNAIEENNSINDNKVLAASAIEYDDNWKTYLNNQTCEDIPAKTCTEGTFNDETGMCEKEIVYSATNNGVHLTVGAGNKHSNYSRGAKLYENITTIAKPITQVEYLGTNWYGVTIDNNAVPLSFTYNTGLAWENINGNDGRLNKVGVWSSNAPNNEWIGFSKCIDVPSTKVYYIGMGADNDCRFKVNGELVVSIDGGNSSTSFYFWHVFPILLNQGQNIIEMEGSNDGSVAAFGAEIYDATEQEITSWTTETELENALLFSTKDLIGTQFQTGETTGYSCPNGGPVNFCGDAPTCASIYQVTVPSTESNQYLNRITNPFLAGIQGIWRTKKSSLYLGERNQTNQAIYASTPNASLDLREDGIYSEFTPFWTQPVSNNEVWGINDDDWTWASKITNYTPYGQEIENQDALYRNSAALFGYNHSLAIAVANNAKQNQIAFDGFEDYNYKANPLEKKHFGFVCNEGDITDEESHSGRFSIKLIANQTKYPSGKYKLRDGLINSGIDSPCELDYGDDIPYTIKPCDVIYPFGPSTSFYPEEREANQTSIKYVMSFWQKQETLTNEVIDYSHIIPSVKINNTNILGQSQSKSIIIDGWQKVEYYFEIPNGTSGEIEIMFSSDANLETCYVDDIRIHPINSSMKSYVYDPISLRLWAELDDNNYATFYEYDEEGKLLRIKKETARGIQTIQESRSSSVK